ncbi:hypothetical protein [Streptomyces sp. NBC_01314]|uniref:hypothetical protein n=1 Tax=Streptomyces sp. NBC_01314 TaxID=2903821 RepID=UPI003089D320|nr:hypothetical protein OG622_41265 [Streptomyces sp. NBC_01314]
MHRPTTTATLLVTVAVSALTGCVTAQHPPPPQASPVPSRPSEPRPDGTTETQIVQAPVREALELIGPPRKSTPSTSTAPKPAVSAPTATTPTPTPPVPPPPQEERRGAPERHGPPPPESRPRIEVPPLPRNIPTEPPKKSDVCALGHKYGGWGKDTPQASICKDVYGR